MACKDCPTDQLHSVTDLLNTKSSSAHRVAFSIFTYFEVTTLEEERRKHRGEGTHFHCQSLQLYSDEVGLLVQSLYVEKTSRDGQFTRGGE